MGRLARISSTDSPTRSKKLTLALVILPTVTCAFYVFLWEPIQSRTETVRGEVQLLEQKIQHYKTQGRHLADREAGGRGPETSRLGENPHLQQGTERVGLRHRVTEMARRHRLEVTLWQPDTMVEGSHENSPKTSVHVQVEGGYHEVAGFFTRLLHLPKVFGISRFTMSVVSGQAPNPLLQTSFVMTGPEASSAAEDSRGTHH